MSQITPIINALNSYLIYIQIGEHYYQEAKINLTKKCLSFFECNGKLSHDWLLSNRHFLIEVFETYSKHLKLQIDEAYDENEISSKKEERKEINCLLTFLKQS